MSSKAKPVFIAIAVIALAVIMGFLTRDKQRQPSHTASSSSSTDTARPSHSAPANKSTRRNTDHIKQQYDLGEEPAGTRKNERLVSFENEEDYRNFLASLADRGLKLLGKSDRLRTARIGFGSNSNLSDIDGAELGYNYIVSIPAPPQQGSAQADAVGFGNDALSWLGITSDNSQWGKGITVAVLDSGVNNHIAFAEGKGNLTQLALTELPADTAQLGHGTAVASIISGDHSQTPGVAPASDILSIRISDETGYSDSLTLAEGIIQAVDGGAQVINISMGSQGNSNVVANAVKYAQENGAVIVASSGNEGINSVSYPAAYDGVIAVGAVEGNGDHLDFSNSGDQIGITAPGYQVNAAWGDDLLTQFTGTSASAPFVSGAIAATMSENPNLTAQQAADLVINTTNEAGLPGTDPDYGQGVLDIGRVMESGTPGVYDVAIASQVLVPPTEPSSLPYVWVTVQNQGTEPLINSPLTINSPTGTESINISSLAPGAIATYKVPVALPYDGSAIHVNSSVQNPAGDQDPRNNTRTDSFLRVTEEP
ncbi:MAG: S8 family peptidase [Akkermansiaceae bacterium]